LNNPFYAALISFALGMAGLLAYALAGRIDFSAIRTVSGVHYSLWLTGLLSAFYHYSDTCLFSRVCPTFYIG